MFGGGGFGTRLNLNLREEKGYSYGVFSALALYDDAGVWYSAGGVQTNKTKESVVEFDKELKGMTGEAALRDRVRGHQGAQDARLRPAVRDDGPHQRADRGPLGERRCR